MPRFLNQEEAFFKCKTEGKFIVLEEIDLGKIRSTLTIALADVQAANILKQNLPKESPVWSSIYKLYYDALQL